jgi:hypothetical protein
MTLDLEQVHVVDHAAVLADAAAAGVEVVDRRVAHRHKAFQPLAASRCPLVKK